MGLDMKTESMCLRIGSYGSFGNYRRNLFKFLYKDELYDYEGFSIGRSSKKKKFSALKVDKALPLINHSDCDGYLQPDECSSCLPHLERYQKYLQERIKKKKQAIADKKKKKQKVPEKMRIELDRLMSNYYVGKAVITVFKDSVENDSRVKFV